MKLRFTSLLLLFQLALVAFAGPPRILHYTETTGYNHGTADESFAMFYALGQEHGWVVIDAPNSTKFGSVDTLDNYACVIFSNTSGNSGLSAAERANFEAYIAGGGSYLGIHAASDTYRHSTANGNKTGTWDWYAENVAGASVQESPNHTSSNHNNTMFQQAIGHPTLASVPGQWNKTEEYYYWQNGYLASGFTELLRVASTGNKSYDAPRMMAHCKDLPGGGRAFYTALGHSSWNYDTTTTFSALLEDAMLWILQPPQAFWIDLTPDIATVPPLEAGYFHLPEAPPIKDYLVYDMSGRIVHQGIIQENKFPIFLDEEGIHLYTGYNFHFTHGVR